MAKQKTKRNNKKKGGLNKNKRRTKHRYRGGNLYTVHCDENGDNCITDKSDFSTSEKYIQKFPDVPPNEKYSIFTFLPNNTQGKEFVNNISGKTTGMVRKDIFERNYVHTRKDLEFKDLCDLLKTGNYPDIMKEIFLSKPDLLKKTTILRLLYKLHKGNSLDDNNFIYDIVTKAVHINEIDNNPKEITLRDHPKFFGLIRDSFKNVYNKDHNAIISINIFKNGLLEDCYTDISDKDVINLMTIIISTLPGDKKDKFSRIYNKNTSENYYYIRHAILFYIINQNNTVFEMFINSVNTAIDDAQNNIVGRVEAARAILRPIENQGLIAAIVAGIAR
jgi:hypothetical protein